MLSVKFPSHSEIRIQYVFLYPNNEGVCVCVVVCVCVCVCGGGGGGGGVVNLRCCPT